MHAAALALKRQVPLHWSPYFDSFLGPTAIDLEEKRQLRPVLLAQGLTCSSRQIRGVLANVISLIAHADFPDEWPNLIQDLVGLLSNGHPDAVHGTLSVLSDFCKTDLSEDQLIPLASDLLPKVLMVFQSSQVG